MVLKSRCVGMPLSNGLPIPPAPGDGVFKRHAEEPDEKRGERRVRKKPPAPMAAPPIRQIAELDPDTLCGRTSLNLPAVERFSGYVEGFVNDEFVAMRKHLGDMTPSDVLGVQLSACNVHLLTSFLAAARINVSDVAANFQVLQQQEHRIWIVPLLNMWSPAYGSPQLLARSGWYAYWFAHGSDDVGLLGILQYRKMRRSFPEKYPTSGFFCAATHDVHQKVWPILRCWSSSKNQAGVIVVGMAANQKPHRKVETGGTYAEQEECSHGHVVHNSRQKRWCTHPDITQVLGLAVVQKAPVQVVHGRSHV